MRMFLPNQEGGTNLSLFFVQWWYLTKWQTLAFFVRN